MSEDHHDFKMIVLTRRLKMPGIMDTMSDQAPLIRAAMGEIMAQLPAKIDALGGQGWMLASHSVTIHSGLLIVTFLVTR
jgi:hypothetical protein